MPRIGRRAAGTPFHTRIAPRPFAVLTTAVTVLMLVSSVGASANPSVSDKRAQAQAILDEVLVLDEELGSAAERFNGANYELGQLTSELSRTREDVRVARVQQSVSQARVAARLRALYINGPSPSSVEVILGARSLNDVLDRIDVAERVAAQDLLIVREAVALRARVSRRERQLRVARERQALVVEQRAAERRAIEGKLAERQRLLASVKDEIARLEEAERRRQAELLRQARLEVERQRQAAEAERARQRARQQAERPADQPSTPAPSSVDGEASSSAAPSLTSAPAPADASKGAQVVSIAMQYLGVPYVWAAADPSVGFDCSGLTTYVFAKVGVSLPHYAAAQYQLGAPVSRDELQPGDLVFFRGLGHMGMYIGGGNMIHAPRTGDVVKISSLSDPYYVANWVGARRVL